MGALIFVLVTVAVSLMVGTAVRSRATLGARMDAENAELAEVDEWLRACREHLGDAT